MANTGQIVSNFTLSASPDTDIWRKPPSSNPLNAFSAPTYYQSQLPLNKFSSVSVTVSAQWKETYDQGGLIFVLPERENEARKWIKTGIEFVGGNPSLSVVACDRWADWSLVPLTESIEREGSMGKGVGIEMRREEDGSLWIYVREKDVEGGEGLRPVREVTWAFEDEDERECWIGVYAARPAKGEGVGELEVGFEGLRIVEREG